MKFLKRCSHIFAGFALLAVASAAVSVVNTGSASAACSPVLPTDKGTVTNTITAPAAGSYRVWTRIKTADTTKNSVYMEIDGTTCNVVVGGTATGLTANTWAWVDYQSGTTTNKFNVTLAAGSHTVVMAGKDDGVMVDRVIFTQDTSCVPTGTGDNCANPPSSPPTVSITAPANNATISTSTTATAAATDDVAIAKVEFYLDNALVATDTTGPYNYTINPASLSVGAHTLVAKAYDTDSTPNVTTSSTVNFTVPDSTAPTVSITAPAAGATVSGTITVSANAADNVGVSKVEFYVDGTLKATDTSSPYSTSIDTTTLTAGSRSLTAKAYDAANNVTTSAAVNVTVSNAPPTDTTAPTVSITAPAAGATISGTAYTVTANASDATGIAKVEFYVDGTLKSTDTSAPYSFSLDTSTLSNGTHSFTAKATDSSTNANAATSSAVSATVSNSTYLPEDINQDTHVNLLDFSILASNFGKSNGAITNTRADINGDLTVNLLDFSRLATKFGTV